MGIYRKLFILFNLFYNSDIKIHLAGNSDSGLNERLTVVSAHKFVLATRNESWGKTDQDTLGKSAIIITLRHSQRISLKKSH